MSEFQIWHGSHRWQGKPEIRPCRKGHYEHGPGIYCTTNLNTASKYAKGGGRIVRLSINAQINWLEDAKMPFDYVMDFVRTNDALLKRRILAADLMQTFDRREQIRTSGMMPVSYLVNLAVNNECLSGAAGQAFAKFLTDNDIHASLYRKAGNEDWVVVFDPEIIVGHEILASRDIDWTEDRLPGVLEQLEARETASQPTPPTGLILRR